MANKAMGMQGMNGFMMRFASDIMPILMPGCTPSAF